MEKRVVVTGMGVISPLGNSIANFWNNLKRGKNGISKISSLDTSSLQVHIAGQSNIQLQEYLDSKTLNKIDRFTAFAIIAANQALKISRINIKTITK